MSIYAVKVLDSRVSVCKARRIASRQARPEVGALAGAYACPHAVGSCCQVTWNKAEKEKREMEMSLLSKWLAVRW